MVNMSSADQALLFDVWHSIVGRGNWVKLKCQEKFIFFLAQAQGICLDYWYAAVYFRFSDIKWIGYIPDFYWNFVKKDTTNPHVYTLSHFELFIFF